MLLWFFCEQFAVLILLREFLFEYKDERLDGALNMVLSCSARFECIFENSEYVEIHTFMPCLSQTKPVLSSVQSREFIILLLAETGVRFFYLLNEALRD